MRAPRSWRLLVVALLCLGVLAPMPATAGDDPVRILIIGDSVAQGSSGDWTWRYRAWQALRGAGADVDFVGPSDDLFDTSTFDFGHHSYADPDFDQDHAARWGMAMAFPDRTITDLVETYRPDVVVETRGINDLTWLRGTSTELAGAVESEIAAARTVDPDIDFVVAELPQVWHGQDEGGMTAVAAYNQVRLPQLATETSTDSSRVVIAGSSTGFQQLVDTWDPGHLSATGEVKVAAAVVDALAVVGVGSGYPAPHPVVTNGHWAPATLAATAGDGTALLTWVRPPGGQDAYVWRRDASTAYAWIRVTDALPGTQWLATGLPNGEEVSFRVQVGKGSAIAAGSSNEVSVVPRGPAPGAPAGVTVTPAAGDLVVNWVADPTATYRITWTARSTLASQTVTATAGPLTLGGLAPGEWYDVAVVAHRAGSDSTPTYAAGLAPVPPSLPAVAPTVSVMPGHDRLRLDWVADPAATSYRIEWVRRAGGVAPKVREVTEGPVVLQGLVAGGRYAVVVTPLNALGAGPATTVTARPTGPRVAGPAGLRVSAGAAGRVRLSWHQRARATAYQVAVRRSGGWEGVRRTSAHRIVLAGAVDGTVFRVRSWHDLVPGGWSTVVRLPRR